MSIQDQIGIIRKEIQLAKEKSPYHQDVTLIAVSKTHPAEMIMEAYDAGIRDFGENKVQELVEKYGQLPNDIRWHMIGHLQTNKVRQIIDKVCLIHSVDSLHLAQKIDEEAAKKGLIANILIEVNAADESSKFGVSLSGAEAFAKELSALSHIRVCGLMTVAPYTENAEENRRFFALLKKLSIDINALNLDNISMMYLSMGMSGDYPVAIEEGANMIRVGTNIFGEREYLFS